jgi:hypothetical protein
MTAFEFVLIQPGTFLMGSPETEENRAEDETQHEVTLTKPYYMQTTSVTQGQWLAVMGENPAHFELNGFFSCKSLEHPVEQVNWESIQSFLYKLNQKNQGFYRLPTEAEWEYACRAGTNTPFGIGDSLEEKANFDWKGMTTPVKSFSPNPWGLYDMHGNVWEYCQDWYGPYPEKSVTDPQGHKHGFYRVIRGGSWCDNADLCRSAYRNHTSPCKAEFDVGFRLVKEYK